MQQGEVPGFSRIMRRQIRERWDSTAFPLFLGILPSGYHLSMRPIKTLPFVFLAKETDSWILDLFADGPGRDNTVSMNLWSEKECSPETA